MHCRDRVEKRLPGLFDDIEDEIWKNKTTGKDMEAARCTITLSIALMENELIDSITPEFLDKIISARLTDALFSKYLKLGIHK